jgi:NADH-quinone oxidoreductase subunit D
MCESLSYRQFIYVTSRMDYLSSHINNHGCALCVEKGMQIEVPARAEGDPRPDGRIDAAGLSSAVVGGDGHGCRRPYAILPCVREREAINDIMEETCGARLTMNYMVPGGVMADIHPDFQKKVKEFIRFFRTKIDEYDELVTGNIIFKSRMKVLAIFRRRMRFPMAAPGPLPGAAA